MPSLVIWPVRAESGAEGRTTHLRSDRLLGELGQQVDHEAALAQHQTL